MANKTGKGCFEKGRSGNPGGRPKAIVDLRELARTHTNAAVKTLADLSTGARSEMARIAAATALLDRGYGKPTQMMGNDPENPFETQQVVTYIPANPRRDMPVDLQVIPKNGSNGRAH